MQGGEKIGQAGPLLQSKIEKVPRGIRGEKSSKDMEEFEEFGLNNWSISKSQNGGRNPESVSGDFFRRES